MTETQSHHHHQLNVIFLPFPAPGHMNPMVDTARLLAKHGTASCVNVTIITTIANSSTFQKAIDTDFNSGFPIRTKVLPFPAAQVGLPDGVENLKDCTSFEMMSKIILAMSMLKDQFELLLQDMQPDCMVTDMLSPWTMDSASKFGIPRIYFYSSSYFSNYASYSVYKHKNFPISPGLPDTIEMKTLQLAEQMRTEFFPTSYFDAIYESERKSYGALYNSFHELESDYEELYKGTIGIKSWSVGPVSAWVNKEEKTNRELELGEDKEWLNWLNSKQNESVLYVSFGSLVRLPYAQLFELAHGLENSGHEFIWVIRKKDNRDDEEGHREISFLENFEQRIKGTTNKGYIIWNWAPQLVILDHPAIGGVVTHCGWNSIIESVNAGLPMITWPELGEQCYNEMLLTHVLKIGVPVAVAGVTSKGEENNAMVTRGEISKAVMLLMGREEEESIEMRKRVRKLSDAAKNTIEEGGSSFNNMMQLIDELKSLKMHVNNT